MDIKLEDFISHYPEIRDQGFYQKIYDKKEFRELKLAPREELSGNPGVLANHQKIVARFISPYTDYQSLLLLHEMGTGKTCSAVGIVEGLKATNKYIHAMIFAPSENLLENFRDELVHRCTSGNYIPENYEDLTQQERVRRINKLTDFYEFNTFETFAKELAGMSDKNIQMMYSNRIFVIDEVHNMIQVVVFSDENKPTQTKLSVYDQFYRLLHCTKNTKIVLLTGTPMQNSPAEIASIMNLIIMPGEQSMPADEKNFMTRFFPGGNLSTDPSIINSFRSFFRGKVSYLKSIASEVRREYVGNHVGYDSDAASVIPGLVVANSSMSDFQERAYEASYAGDARGFFSSSRQTSLFVFPDGSYGQAGFQKYITQYKRNNIIHYRLKEEFRSALTSGGLEHDKILNKIERYSCKYAAVLRNILSCRGQKKVFVFGEFVYGCGIILFSCLLKLFGYDDAESDINTKAPRFVLAITSTLSTRELKNVIEKFNSPENIRGEYIQVLIGSKIVSEGYTFKDIQVVEILTPHWNYSVTSQAIARGYRFGSHRNFNGTGVIPEYKIFNRVALTKSGSGIDLEMYQICEEKKVKIEAVENIIREMAFDCQLNYARNVRDFDYTCEGITPKMDDFDEKDEEILNQSWESVDSYSGSPKIFVEDPEELDYSSFLGPYGGTDYDYIRQTIHDYFSQNFFITRKNLHVMMQNFKWIQVVQVLFNMITNGEVLIDKYGFRRYLKAQNNIYFLSDKLLEDTFFSVYYIQSPQIFFPKETLEHFVKHAEIRKHEQDLNKFWKLSDESEMIQIIQNLSARQKASLLEKAIKVRESSTNINSAEAFILKFFENYYKKFDGEVLVSWMLLESEQVVHQFNSQTKTWVTCDKDNLFFWEVEEYLKEEKERVENNPYKCYGQYSKYTNDFCIRDINFRPDKKHKQTSGKRCSNWDKHELINLIMNRLQIDLTDDQKLECDTKYRGKNLQELSVMMTKYTVTFPQDADWIKKALLFYGMRRENLCIIVRNWFESQNLLIEDSKCGVQGKEKI